MWTDFCGRGVPREKEQVNEMLNNEREGIILMDVHKNSSPSAQNDTTSIAISVSRVPKQRTAKKSA